MNRLQELLQDEIKRSYRHAISASSSLKTIRNCLVNLDMLYYNMEFYDNFLATEIAIDNVILKMEKYMEIERY